MTEKEFPNIRTTCQIARKSICGIQLDNSQPSLMT